jgi:hypothetical protein
VVSWLERLAGLLGFALFVGGIAMIHVPAALIVAGALLMASVLWRVKGWA